MSEGRWSDLAARAGSAVVMIGVGGACILAGGFWFQLLIALSCGAMMWELVRMLDAKAQTVALYYMCISMAGLFIGPPAIGLFNDFVFGTDGIRYSMALVPALFGIPVLLIGPYVLKRYREANAYYESLGQG